jgi:excisionase family DNA binding protein
MARPERRPASLDALPELLTVDELAAFLRCGRGTAYALIARGDLPAVRIGRLLRVPRQALAAMVRAGAYRG